MKNKLLLVVLAFLILLTTSCDAETKKFITEPTKVFDNRLVVDMVSSAIEGDIDNVSKLIKAGANVNFQGKEGITPLLWMLGEKNENGFRLLLTLGADPNQTTLSGGTVLTFAASNDNPHYLRLSLEHGGDANYFHSRRHGNVIFDAISPGHLEHVRLFVEHGADVNVRDGTGETPLMAAASINQYDIVYYLLEHGADFTIGNNWGKTIIDRIENNNISKDSDLYLWRSKVVAFLHSKGVEVSPRNP